MQIKYDFIGISDIKLYGTINPKFTMIGTVKLKNYKFKFFADGDEIEFQVLNLGNNSFLLSSDLPKGTKKITIYLENKEDKQSDSYLIYTGKTYFIKRVIKRIIGSFRNTLFIIKRFFYVLDRGIKFLWREYHFVVPIKMIPKYFNDFKKSMHYNRYYYNPLNIDDYNRWLKNNEQKSKIKELNYNPKISILVPVYNSSKKVLSECIESVLNQTYQNWELCLVDDASQNKETIETLKNYENYDERIKIKYKTKNEHISKTTNDALKIATGDYIGLLDNDDILTNDALYEVAKVLNNDNKIDMIYSDEDKIDLHGNRCCPHFKPDFSPDTLMSLNYICHFTVIRKNLVEKVGGFEVGLEGAQDHDLFLKVSEKTSKIHHISKILYHWRMIEGSTSLSQNNKKYANDKGKLAIENALKRRGLEGVVEKDKISGYYIVHYKTNNPLISIIIPTRDYADILEPCLKSIYEKTIYKNYEVIIANNGSEKKETFDLFKKYKKKYRNFKVIDINTEFNYSYINNTAIKSAKGEYIVLLNNDTEIISPNWLDDMVGYASLPHIGAVGVKLLYPDNTVQHGGVILGLGGVASHAYIGASENDQGLYGRLRVPYNYSAVTAACLMVSKKKYFEVNGLEEKLKVAYNDIDFNIKLLKKGYYNIFLPMVKLTHYESKSRGLDTTTEKYQRFLLESEYMYKTWNDIIENDPMYNVNYSKKGWFLLDQEKKK